VPFDDLYILQETLSICYRNQGVNTIWDNNTALGIMCRQKYRTLCV